ncbi:substrate-binding domain-containing protein [Paeniglutamicibacter sp. ABSL32-1]|uniref:sugar ABC transporter substrate-binding protein n=1 Tax=Paeniglutamicibacter quisquiliarum TaxID=2849498 RepID=UPI001C2D5ADE|nr:sugar ABC transporter substrate-binding protein [Paeniglutamicibacter quisquiliarum]MBV1781050.1 substrate-binding domain-containing protein [Paeniglutamicibacter quisquiliarum]
MIDPKNSEAGVASGPSAQLNAFSGVRRRQFLQGLGLGAVALASGGALTGCSAPLGSGSGQTAAAGPGVALASVPTLTNEYFTMWNASGKEAATALGLSYRMQSYEGSAATQINQLRSAKAAGASQVVTFPINNDAVRQMGEILAEQDIPLGTSFSATPWMVPSEPGFQDLYSTLFTPREVLGQKALSEAVFKAIGGSGNVVYIQGAPTNRTSNAREKGFDMAVAGFPGIKVLARQDGKENGQDTRPVVQAMLSRFDKIDAIICHNSSSALGAVSVLEEKGNDRIKVGGTDEQLAILDKLIQGPNVVAVQSIFGTWLGGYMLVRNFDLTNGIQYDPAERMMFQDSLVLDTKESAIEYKRVATGATSGFDWKKMSRHLHPDDWDSQVALAPVDPVPFFTEDLNTKRPEGFEFPPALQDSLDGGAIQRLTKLYSEHAVQNPYAEAIRLTSTGATVFGTKF